MTSCRSRSRWWPLTRRRVKRPWPFAIICLTGSIAMGKSTASAMLRRLGWPVFDADADVHRLMRAGGAAVKPIAAAFDNVMGSNGIDRAALGQAVFGNRRKLAKLEAILHPLVQHDREQFFMHAAMSGRKAVVLDIPLLFEVVRHERACDVIAVVSAPAFLQQQRAMARPGMTQERLKNILARQTPDHVKRRKADLLIPSGLGKREAWRRLQPLRNSRTLRKVKQAHFPTV